MSRNPATAGPAAPAPVSPRIWVAVVAAVALHVVVVVLRDRPIPAGVRSVPLVSAMTVRSLPSHSDAAVAPAVVAPTPVRPIEPAPPIEPIRPLAANAAVEPDPRRESTGKQAAAESRPPMEPATPRTAPATVAAEDADYLGSTRLEPGPRPLDDIEPDYPEAARSREGTVVLRLLISDTGRVDRVDVVRAEPAGVFEDSAVDAFSKARFSPGFLAGRPVRSQMTVEVTFMPIDRGARVSGRGY